MNNFGLYIDALKIWGVADNSNTLLAHRSLLLGTSANSVVDLLGLLFLFCLILAAAVYVTRFVGNKAMSVKHNNIKIIETYRMSTNTAIGIVKIADKYLAVSISKDSINLLTELDEDNIIINQNFAKNGQNIQFNDLLIKAKEKIKVVKKVDQHEEHNE